MHQARAYRAEGAGRRRPDLHVAGGHPERARPAWGILAGGVVVTMALWAAGILELPASRRLIDWIGTMAVLTVLVVWVRFNGRFLATAHDRPERDDRVHVRLVRSRRPPLAAVAGPDIRPPRRR